MAEPIATSRDACSLIDDPRTRPGVRHPDSALPAPTFLGLHCRQTDLASIERWALGFTRNQPPHATAISRAPARRSLEQFGDVFAR